MAVVSMEMPDEMIEFAKPSNKDQQLRINAMILYPYIQQGMISHGRAAEILGMFKIDLITLYGKMGLSYIDMSEEEIDGVCKKHIPFMIYKLYIFCIYTHM